MQEQSPPRVAATLRRTGRAGGAEPPRQQPVDWAARELHDRVGGELALALRQLELAQAYLAGQEPEAAAERLNGSLRAVDQAMQATRELAVQLTALAGRTSRRRTNRPAWLPRPLTPSGRDAAARQLYGPIAPGEAGSDGDVTPGPELGERLATLVAGLRPVGTDIRLDLTGLPPQVPAATAHQTLRILGEALRNAFTHAEAGEVVVWVSAIGGTLVAEVRDDGLGFDPTGPHPDGRENGRGLGLASMRERARSVGGATTVVSQPGRGTRVTVRLPLSAAAARSCGDPDCAGAR